MSTNRQTGAILLIAGTCIGAGMLALPITTAAAGFWPAIALLIVCWMAMYLTGLYVLEANLCVKENANFVSMAKATLGRWGEVVAWITYLLLLYSLMAAYLSGGGAILVNTLQPHFQQTLGNWIGPLPWVIVAALIIYCGAKPVDGLNRLFMIGLITTFIALVVFTSPHIKAAHLTSAHPAFLFAALPIVITAFGYHVIVPSLRVYLQSKIVPLKRTIFLGSVIPLVVYLIWEFVVFGAIPVGGAQGLLSILHSGQPATQLSASLAQVSDTSHLVVIARFFIFFAIASSFLGISFSIFDFIADGFKIPKTLIGRLLIAIITFLPPFLYAIAFPKGFILALSYAGVFVAILHGILPALMVGAARLKGLSVRYNAPGGVVGLLLILLFSATIIVAQISINL